MPSGVTGRTRAPVDQIESNGMLQAVSFKGLPFPREAFATIHFYLLSAHSGLTALLTLSARCPVSADSSLPLGFAVMDWILSLLSYFSISSLDICLWYDITLLDLKTVNGSNPISSSLTLNVLLHARRHNGTLVNRAGNFSLQDGYSLLRFIPLIFLFLFSPVCDELQWWYKAVLFNLPNLQS